MKLWLITQDINNGYDTYDSAVVAAGTEDQAKAIHPSGDNKDWSHYGRGWFKSWCKNPKQVQATYLGDAAEGQPLGVVLASYNSG